MSIFLAFVVGAMISFGSYMIVHSRSRKLTLASFYEQYPMRSFAEGKLQIESTAILLDGIRRRLAKIGARLASNKNMVGPIERIDALCELAQARSTGAIWMTQTLIVVAISVPVAIFLMMESGVLPVILLPAVLGFGLYANLKRKADKHRARMQQQLPSIMALMGAASEQLTSLEGSRGVLNWTCMTIDDEVTQLFRKLQIRSVAENVHLENIFEDAADRLQMTELGLLAETFALYRKTGRGLREAFINMANTWRKEQERTLESSMARKTFLATVPLVLFDIPALLIILLTPAAFTIIHDVMG